MVATSVIDCSSARGLYSCCDRQNAFTISHRGVMALPLDFLGAELEIVVRERRFYVVEEPVHDLVVSACPQSEHDHNSKVPRYGSAGKSY